MHTDSGHRGAQHRLGAQWRGEMDHRSTATSGGAQLRARCAAPPCSRQPSVDREDTGRQRHTLRQHSQPGHHVDNRSGPDHGSRGNRHGPTIARTSQTPCPALTSVARRRDPRSESRPEHIRHSRAVARPDVARRGPRPSGSSGPSAVSRRTRCHVTTPALNLWAKAVRHGDVGVHPGPRWRRWSRSGSCRGAGHRRTDGAESPKLFAAGERGSGSGQVSFAARLGGRRHPGVGLEQRQQVVPRCAR